MYVLKPLKVTRVSAIKKPSTPGKDNQPPSTVQKPLNTEAILCVLVC